MVVKISITPRMFLSASLTLFAHLRTVVVAQDCLCTSADPDHR